MRLKYPSPMHIVSIIIIVLQYGVHLLTRVQLVKIQPPCSETMSILVTDKTAK